MRKQTLEIKVFLEVVVCIAAVAAIAASYIWMHSIVLEGRDTVHLRAAKLRGAGGAIVRVTGLSGLSAYSVKEITTQRESSSIIVFVHLVLARHGLSGTFEYDVPVPADVNEIRFGREKVLIWKRAIDPL